MVVWDDSEDALVADGAEEVLAGGLVLAIPALRPRTSTILDHVQKLFVSITGLNGSPCPLCYEMFQG